MTWMGFVLVCRVVIQTPLVVKCCPKSGVSPRGRALQQSQLPHRRHPESSLHPADAERNVGASKPAEKELLYRLTASLFEKGPMLLT